MELEWRRHRTANGDDETYERQGSKAVLVGHLVYFTGLRNERGHTGSILDLQRHVWTTIAATDPNLTLFFHSATLFEDCILFFGAEHDDSSAQLYALDLAVTEIRMIPTYGDNPGLAGFHSGDLYEEERQLLCFGNLTADWRQRGDSLTILHLDYLRWQFIETIGASPSLRVRHGSCIANHTLFVLDGTVTFLVYTLRLNQPTYSWSRIVSSPKGIPNTVRDSASMFYVGSNRILILGGMKGQAWRDMYTIERCCSEKGSIEKDVKVLHDALFPKELELGSVVQQPDRLIVLQPPVRSKCHYFELKISKLPSP